MAQPAGDPLAGNTRYRKIKDINKGSFGFVVLAENLETREQVAIKFTRVDSEQDVKHAHREIMNHQRLLHPHVVQLKEVFAAKPFLALVMEFVPNGDMFQYADDEVRAVVHDVYVSGKSARHGEAGGVDGSVDVDDYMTSQDLKDQ
ncbi:hypothetical protein CHLNCDRAFT_51150 [Chlorella variabilis]|uniref:Protein kinase domain-containing protein n=1 Tax=Chlorella variabilis TaxID=554065 RepID=E1Z9V1_CHLVA|nr:hypothetical protein CHLNCDRAFT_51150 [Chlorella variabilis]EFN57836.1 hypothetical protein CHLNCDRAFT_51150 [Chlorella variabilis]|eukprot:XP_005849938.1 hypothetical protein CHLNCDRAFT_51150 [Chlorella variabilis]